MRKRDTETNWHHCGSCSNTAHIILHDKFNTYVKCKNCGFYGKIMPNNAYMHVGFELHI